MITLLRALEVKSLVRFQRAARLLALLIVCGVVIKIFCERATAEVAVVLFRVFVVLDKRTAAFIYTFVALYLYRIFGAFIPARKCLLIGLFFVVQIRPRYRFFGLLVAVKGPAELHEVNPVKVLGVHVPNFIVCHQTRRIALADALQRRLDNWHAGRTRFYAARSLSANEVLVVPLTIAPVHFAAQDLVGR